MTADKVRENRLRRMAERQGPRTAQVPPTRPAGEGLRSLVHPDVDREIEAAEIGGYDVATESFTGTGGRLRSRVRSSSSRSATTSTS